MATKTLSIHSENILPIIKKWLYSDKDIFLRELVSNACDAIHKVKILRDKGVIQVSDDDFRIDIIPDKNAKTLKIIDNGIGMTAEEVENYISQIAFSSAEEFLEKYQSKNEKDQMIGHFGLGFYSAYMAAKHVDIDTLSYQENQEPVSWSCDGSCEYEIDKGKRSQRGTEITLHIENDSEEYLEISKLREILRHYSSFLPYPVYLNDEKINSQEPLWVKAPSECQEKDYLEFYRYLYPLDEDPLFWIHLSVDYPFHLKGILYFPKMKRDFDPKKSTIKLYCNRVFVSDNCKDILPEYLMMLRGVIDSPDIPLNVSRSFLQMDRTVKQLSGHISKKVADSLTSLHNSNKQRFFQCWKDVSVIVKLGVLEDEKFYERVKKILFWKNTKNEWVTTEDYLERNKEKTKNRLLYSKDQSQLSNILDIYHKKGIEVLTADHPIDTYLISHLEGKLTPASFQRIDGAIDEHILNKDLEKTILDADGKTEAGKLADIVRSKLNEEGLEIEAKSLDTEDLPGFVMFDEKERRMRDYFASFGPSDEKNGLSQIGKRTFVLNTNHPLIANLQKIDRVDTELATKLVQELYEIALISQREMDPGKLQSFISKTQSLLANLVERIIK